MDNQYNRLILEKSPYLLQHADNPVDWYPWGVEAFEEATKKDKPIFLSIGYSTCHWCHVMEHESFEDEEVAKLMNDVFISIKVDREERPDIDSLYMTAAQMMTGSGGWPLNIIMTPDKKPFYSATYIPKNARFSQIGMLDLIPRIKEMWTTRRADLLNSAEKVASALCQIPDNLPGSRINESTLDRAYEQLTQRFDSEHGGFSSAPKFPTPHQLFFLLRYWRRLGDENALYMVEKTLQQIRGGGVYDHIGFGFHRYSTDPQWLVPHFEKMLYDQALLSIVYTEAYQATMKEEYAKTSKEVLTYILRDMTSLGGGFYSGEDADSEGEEGKFYLWTYEEIEQLLSKDELDIIVRAFNIEKGGNFLAEATGQKSRSNILYMKDTLAELAAESRISEQEFQSQLEQIRKKLFTYRENRVHPHKDDKILTDWNGLMITAFAIAARVFDEPQYVIAADRAVDFIMDHMRTPDGRLLHRYRDGQAAITSHVDDYAFLIWGLIELYETTFEPSYLKMALELNGDMIEHFWDDVHGGFYFTADDAEDLLARQKDIYDGSIPSGNSVAALNLILLSRITANSDLEEKAIEIGIAFSGFVNDSPFSYTQLLTAVDFLVGPSYEVIIVGNSRSSDTIKMLRALWNHFIPSKIVILKPSEEETSDIIRIAPYVGNYTAIDGKATAYICVNYLCSLPTTDVSKMLEFFDVRQS